MLTPFDVKSKVNRTKDYAKWGDIGRFHFKKAERDLFIEVLQEIAKGSIDPRSLAIEVLNLLKEQK